MQNLINHEALLVNMQDLPIIIRKARICAKNGDRRLPNYMQAYLRTLRACYELGGGDQQPIPINPGLVGLSATEKFKKEWQLA